VRDAAPSTRTAPRPPPARGARSFAPQQTSAPGSAAKGPSLLDHAASAAWSTWSRKSPSP